MQANSEVRIGTGAKSVVFGNQRPLSFIAGPCALESRDHEGATCMSAEAVLA
ncbi:MAG: hypothetical protein J0H14_26755 [Alphaproteobacteria bacterium]|nr:hypothetical protein [Alphaproteobacteria bacterium]